MLPQRFAFLLQKKMTLKTSLGIIILKGVTGKKINPSCVDYGIINCRTLDKHWPDFCLTTNLEEGELDRILERYMEPDNSKYSLASAEVEYEGYRLLTRVEEIIAVARKISA